MIKNSLLANLDKSLKKKIDGIINTQNARLKKVDKSPPIYSQPVQRQFELKTIWMKTTDEGSKKTVNRLTSFFGLSCVQK